MRDTGVGISESRLPHIFDLFFQSDQSPDRAHGGLGVGLTLARRLVDLHEVPLTAASAGAGRGSEFRIALPRATAQPATALDAPQAIASGHAPLTHDCACWSWTIALLRPVRSAALTVMGHEVIIANDSKSGIELAERVRPDVILLDIGLPEMDSCSVARRLRSLPATSTTRIIALTGYTRPSGRGRMSAKPASDLHLVKPVDADELEAALCRK